VQPAAPTKSWVRQAGAGPLALLLGLGLVAAPAAAQEECECRDCQCLQADILGTDLPAHDPLDAKATASVRTGGIRIDGLLDEVAWQAAPVISGFVQREPLEGEPAGEDTHVRVLFDDKAVYVSARMFESDPSVIHRPLLRRDQGGPFDWFQFALDTNHDGRTAYRFQVNASGSQVDWYIYDDHRSDGNWDAVWESAVSYDSLGWVAEIRVPLSQIRYESSAEPQTWGANFGRRRSAAAEMSTFALQRQAVRGIVSQYGDIEGIRLPSSVRRVEARPYLLSSFHNGTVEEGDPFFDGRDTGVRAGVDLRLGLGSAFTLDATVNPDFGQVEADPAEINLTAFETFFEERRPFFVEDAQVFEFQLSGFTNRLFYSRRIGRAPQLDGPDGADFEDVSQAATIGGAAKLTGRTSGGLSLGALGALTQAEEGKAYFSDDGKTQGFLAEPRTGYGLITAQQDLNGGASQVRGIVTALQRDLPADRVLPDQAYSAGVAFEHQWSDRQWRLDGFFAASHVRGSPEAITAIRRFSNHYFQRPDATRLELDETATSLTGAEWRIQLDRQNREHWNGSVWLAEVTKGFEVNDLGFSRNSERLDGGFRYGYQELRPGSVFRDWRVNLFSFYNFSHEALDDPGSWSSWRRAYTNGRFNLDSRFTLLNYHGGDIRLGWNPNYYSRSATRGGPVMIEPGNVSLGLGINTDRRQDTSFRGGVDFTRGFRDVGGRVQVNGNLILQPSTQLQIELGPRFSVQSDAIQYVTSTSVLPYEPTYGKRYLFGDLRLETLSLQTRVDYTFTPNLSLQVYAEPFISSGEYVSYRQLASAGGYDFREFREGTAVVSGEGVACVGGDICLDGEGDQHVDLNGDGLGDFSFGARDFTAGSFTGNAVLRWEYRPGSTLFLVWQRQQEHDSAFGNFDFRRDLRRLFTAPANDRLIVKVNYWLSL